MAKTWCRGTARLDPGRHGASVYGLWFILLSSQVTTFVSVCRFSFSHFIILFFSISSIPLSRDIPKAHSSGAQLIHKVWALDSIQQGSQSPCFLNKIIDILENHSESLSFSLSLQEKRGIEKKRETQNDSLECQSIYSKSTGSVFSYLRQPSRSDQPTACSCRCCSRLMYSMAFSPYLWWQVRYCW